MYYNTRQGTRVACFVFICDLKVTLKGGGKKMLKRFFKEEAGQGMVEYGLIIGLIAIIVIAVFVALGPQIKNMFEKTVDSESVGKGQAAISAAIYN